MFHFSTSSCKKASSCNLISPDFILSGWSRDLVRLQACCQHDKSRLSARLCCFISKAAARRTAPTPSEQTLNSSSVSPNGSVAVKIKVAEFSVELFAFLEEDGSQRQRQCIYHLHVVGLRSCWMSCGFNQCGTHAHARLWHG